MDQQTNKLIIKIGGSPLDTPEFVALKAEFNKLNHPSRPEISWTLIESLSLTLFKTNGIDLQSGVYYTLARLHLHGLSGFTEGCELLASVVVSQWDNLWPEQPHHRCDIFNWFNSKASVVLRQLNFNSTELRLVYRAERALQLMIDQIEKTSWSKLPKLENLLWFFQNTAKTLEQRDNEINKARNNAPVNVPPLVYIHQPGNSQGNISGLSSSPETIIIQEKIPVEIKRMSARNGFFIGLLSSAVLFLMIGTTLYYSVKKELTAITAQPEGAIAQWLYRPELSSYANHLSLMEQQTPLFTLKKSEQLLETAQKLWPNNADQSYASRQWLNRMSTILENSPIDNSWANTELLIQQLSDKIVQQERNRGSFTLSYLKTAIYGIQQSHQKNIPIEEKLHQLSEQIKHEQTISPASINNIDKQLNGLLARYYELQKQAENKGLKPHSF